MNLKSVSPKDMIPCHGAILVSVNRESKSTHKIEGTDIELYIDRTFGWNEREKNPVNAKIVNTELSWLKKGDEVVCWHNSFHESKLVFEEKTEEGKIHYYIINPKDIFFIIKDGEIIPASGYFLAERIYKLTAPSTIIITTAEEKENNRVLVKKTNENDDILSEGDIAIIETMADYEVVFQHNGKEHRVIRVKNNDVMGIDHSFKIDDKIMRTGI